MKTITATIASGSTHAATIWKVVVPIANGTNQTPIQTKMFWAGCSSPVLGVILVNKKR